MAPRVHPFLMFQAGDAAAAMELYTSLFPSGHVLEVQRYGPGEPGAEGSIKTARFTIGGQTILCTDSPPVHAFTFTPSFSLFVECESEEELRRLASALGEGGTVHMPLASYGFSRQFTWLSDRHGVSWQLDLK